MSGAAQSRARDLRAAVAAGGACPPSLGAAVDALVKLEQGGATRHDRVVQLVDGSERSIAPVWRIEVRGGFVQVCPNDEAQLDGAWRVELWLGGALGPEHGVTRAYWLEAAVRCGGFAAAVAWVWGVYAGRLGQREDFYAGRGWWSEMAAAVASIEAGAPNGGGWRCPPAEVVKGVGADWGRRMRAQLKRDAELQRIERRERKAQERIERSQRELDAFAEIRRKVGWTEVETATE